MKKILLILSLFTSITFAGEQTGKIGTFYARASDNLHLVQLVGDQSKNKPSCASNHYWLIKDEHSTTGKSQISQILAAKMANKTVIIYGLNTCSRWPDGEDINYIVILDK
ncbi:hypothetical protein [Photobacterium leiognathi]|uniref:hypothetical protein n=1 Tax=Photobacterium leiognathi TaxID=553611 RepID=UPI002738C6D0|nr:hypothetical protein [Photobacterium leiognathi]